MFFVKLYNPAGHNSEYMNETNFKYILVNILMYICDKLTCLWISMTQKKINPKTIIYELDRQ
jgi:hypothetical protein